MNATAVLKYDFDSELWLAVAEWESVYFGAGATPEEAVQNLRRQCNKHELWP